jgi:hypothetical protein
MPSRRVNKLRGGPLEETFVVDMLVPLPRAQSQGCNIKATVAT